MSDSYHYFCIDKDTRETIYPDIDLYDNIPRIGNFLTCDGGIPYKVVNVKGHSEFKGYNDHGSDDSYRLYITLERMTLSMGIIRSLDAEVPFISLSGEKLYCEGKDMGYPITKIYMDCRDGLMSLYDNTPYMIRGIDLKTLIIKLCVASEEQLKERLGSLFRTMPGVREFKEGYLDRFNIPYGLKKARLGTKKIVYFHGFGSSCLSSTVKTLQELLPEFIVIAENISIDPNYALRQLKDLCEIWQPELVVGTSMGGMYAQQMRGFKRICINPAFDLSQHKDILHEGTFKFLNPRPDGATLFTITPEVISHFEEMEAHQFDDITDEDRENVYGLFADNDTIVNCEDIFRQHYQNVIHFHGEHRLNRQVIEEVLVPLIKEITSK